MQVKFAPVPACGPNRQRKHGGQQRIFQCIEHRVRGVVTIQIENDEFMRHHEKRIREQPTDRQNHGVKRAEVELAAIIGQMGQQSHRRYKRGEMQKEQRVREGYIRRLAVQRRLIPGPRALVHDPQQASQRQQQPKDAQNANGAQTVPKHCRKRHDREGQWNRIADNGRPVALGDYHSAGRVDGDSARQKPEKAIGSKLHKRYLQILEESGASSGKLPYGWLLK